MASGRSLLKKAFFRVIAFTFITAIGAIVFSFVERPNADKALKNKGKLLDSLQKEMKLKYNMSHKEFENFAKRSHEALDLGGPAWDYVDGLRFAFETLTTIGYGAISPSTTTGQALCIVFALFGIPVTILTFKAVGELISRGISSLIAKTERKCFKREVTHVEAKCTVVTCFLMVAMLLFGTGLQILTEDWTFLVGFYFWFVTLTTIGYGDFIPNKTLPWRVAIQITWTILGLCVVSSVLNALAALIEKRRELKCEMCSCTCLGEPEWETTQQYEKRGTEMNQNKTVGNEKNGKYVPRANCNGAGHKKKAKHYRNMTYV